MGNQGQAGEGARILKEWLEAGVIGPVREVHCWTNRPVWPQGAELPAPAPAIPDTLDWNLWQGVAPVRSYSPLLVPFKWRGYWEYGTGALGDMGCHYLEYEYRTPQIEAEVARSVEFFRRAAAASDADLIAGRVTPPGFTPDARALWKKRTE